MANPAPRTKKWLFACCAATAGLLLLAVVLSCGAPGVSPPAALLPGSLLGDSPLPTPHNPSSPLATPSSPLPSPSATASPSASPSPTLTPSNTPSPTPSPTATPTETPTATPSPTASPTATPTPGPTPDGQERVLEVPILMYHYISAPPPDADAIRRDLSVPPERFASHLLALRNAGYESITLRRLFDTLTRGLPLPEKPVVITMDDGYADAYDGAFPLLRQQGFTAAFFVITDFVNEARPEYATWDQLREMAAAGMEVGCHSRNHPDLSGRSVDYLVWQALGCKESIELELGFHPRFISYPSGLYDQRTIEVFQSAHYWGGLTSHQGNVQSSSRPFELVRLRVRGSYTAQDLLELLELRW